MSNAAGRIKAGLAMSPRRRRRFSPSEAATTSATARLTTATRLTTDVITFAAIVTTIVVLAAGMIVAPFAIATWYIPDSSRTSDNLGDQMREAEQKAPADPLMLDMNCANEDSGCFHEFSEFSEVGDAPRQ